MSHTRTSGRGWAVSGALLGGLVSITANVAHSFIPPTGSPADWRPEPLAVGFAVVWPVILYWAIEVLARTAWPTGVGWALIRWVGLIPVALVAAFVSYRHLSGLLAHYGEDGIITVLGPIGIDGFMIVCTGAILASSHKKAPSTTDTLPVPEISPENPSPAGHDSAQSSGPEVVVGEPVDVPAHLVPTARFAVTNHQQTTGRPITADELSARLSIPQDMAGNLLTLFDIPSPALNGTREAR